MRADRIHGRTLKNENILSFCSNLLDSNTQQSVKNASDLLSINAEQFHINAFALVLHLAVVR